MYIHIVMYINIIIIDITIYIQLNIIYHFCKTVITVSITYAYKLVNYMSCYPPPPITMHASCNCSPTQCYSATSEIFLRFVSKLLIYVGVLRQIYKCIIILKITRL